MGIQVSVIICTRNNADSLSLTLTNFIRIREQSELAFELILIDNASTDHTNRVVRDIKKRLAIRYVYEMKTGLSHARNAGIREAIGNVILFTDDDVIPCEDWVVQLASPLLEGFCQSITGRIELAERLKRSWMKPMHRTWLAASDTDTASLVGACMGFHRSVLDKVPDFDIELGAGALGYAEETLFSYQLDTVGYSRHFVTSNCVVHSPDISRLCRSEWLKSAKNRGLSTAYIRYHWEHNDPFLPIARLLCFKLKMAIRKLMKKPCESENDIPSEWELTYITEIETIRGYFAERHRTRRYSKKGLIRF